MVTLSKELDFFNLTEDEHKLLKEIKNLLYNDACPNWKNRHQLEDALWNNYLNEYTSLSLDTIIKKVKEKHPSYSEENINKIIQIMLVNEQIIIRNDILNKGIFYKILPKDIHKSSYTEFYVNVKADHTLKKVLLISDTHIGSKELTNFELIHNVYDYAIKRNIKYCFHLGDIFDGIKDIPEHEKDKKICQQINLFNDYYPHPHRNELITYAIKGNHDESIDQHLKNSRLYVRGSMLRGLSIFNDSFYILHPRRNDRKYSHASFSINNFKIKLTHEAYASEIIPNSFTNHKLDGIHDYDKIKEYLNRTYNLLISGHRHMAMITNIKPNEAMFEHLYLSVPSLSNFSYNSCIAIVLNFIYQNEQIIGVNIEPLYCDSNNSIYSHNEIYFKFTEKNPEFVKKL